MADVTFEGGEKLKAFFDKAGKGGIKAIETGVFETAKYSNGTPVAYVAAIHEFGVGVPERPAIRIAIKKQKKVILDMLKKKIDPEKLVIDKKLGGLIGQNLQGAIQQSIVALDSPENLEATKKRKKSSNPLIDTGVYLRSITYKVVQ